LFVQLYCVCLFVIIIIICKGAWRGLLTNFNEQNTFGEIAEAMHQYVKQEREAGEKDVWVDVVQSDERSVFAAIDADHRRMTLRSAHPSQQKIRRLLKAGILLVVYDSILF